jgi:hypothetical protein
MTTKLGISLIIASSAGLIACSPRSSAKAHVEPEAPAAARQDPELLLRKVEHLSWSMRGSALDTGERAQVEALLRQEQPDIPAVARLLVGDDKSAEHALGILLPQFGSLANVPYVALLGGVLSKFKDASGREIHYLEPPFGPAKPCDAKDAVKVRPWWDTGSEIWVCPSAYRPDKLVHDDGIFCPNPTSATLHEDCGCGPYMMLCFQSEEQRHALRVGLFAELMRTVKHNVESDAALTELFTQNATFRDPMAELYERRHAVAYGKDPDEVFRDYGDWPREGRMAPRKELFDGQHAGLLTTPPLLRALPAPRERMQVYADNLWCLPPRSVKVETSAVLELPTEFRVLHEEGFQIAHMEGCETCHARIDYSLPFFRSYSFLAFFPPQPGRKGLDQQNQPMGKIYIDGLNDFRGEAPANPHGYGSMAVKVPEFRQCMSKRIVDQVFGESAAPGDYQAVQERFTDAASYRALLMIAATRFLEATREEPRIEAPRPSSLPVAEHAGDEVSMSPELSAMVESHCLDCHGAEEQSIVSLERPALPRELLLAMLEAISSQRMPKGEVLSDTERFKFIRHLSTHVWRDPHDLEIGFRYFSGGHEGIRILPPRTLYDIVGARTGQRVEAGVPVPYHGYGRDHSTYTPTIALSVVGAALDACKAQHPKADEATLRKCVVDATQVSGLLSF